MEFRLKTIIKSSAKKIYSAWLSSAGHSKMTGGEAVISDKLGDKLYGMGWLYRRYKS